MDFDLIQYVALGPRLKIIIMNILPEEKHNELKYSLNIAFLFLSIIVEMSVPNVGILLVIREKATALDGPWSATEANSTKKRKNVIVSTRKRDFHSISCIFSILGAIKL